MNGPAPQDKLDAIRVRSAASKGGCSLQHVRSGLNRREPIMRIVVTGASGLLGRTVVRILREHFSVVGVAFAHPSEDSASLDIRDAAAVDGLFRSGSFDACVHCAARTRVADCERNPEEALLVNRDGTAHIAAACRRHGAKLVHVSTDFVFAGTSASGYAESAPPSPLQVYGKTKAAAEQEALRNHDTALVRVGLLYGFNGAGLPGGWPLEVASALKSGRTVRANARDIRQPTLIDDVAGAVRAILEQRMCGILHVAGSTPLTRVEWARVVASLMDVRDARIEGEEGSSDGIARPHRAWLLCTRADAQQLAPKTDPVSGTAGVLRAAGFVR